MQRLIKRLHCPSPKLATRPATHRSYTSSAPAAKRPSNGPKPALDIKHIRQNPELYETTCRERLYESQAGNPAKIIALSEQLVQLQHSGRGLRERANLLRRVLANPATLTDDSTLGDLKALSREELRADARRVKEELAGIVRAEADARREVEALALALPNLTSDETPRGAEPRLLRHVGRRPEFDEEGRSSGSGAARIWRSHAHIGAELGLLDFAAAAQSSGWGWYYLVEMLAWTRADPAQAREVFEEMLDVQTEMLESLGLHARVLEMPTADLGASAARKVDMEAWFPSRQEHSDGWGEVSSASICTDYQTRRLQTRARPGGRASGSGGGDDVEFPWTLNGTALAVPRVLAALLEVGWDERARTVAIPECLRPWMDGLDKIGPPTNRN
ncbi:seryl-tRNA synthetase synthetase [Cordyceps fumosorosea ARSEF 2679]|uniref:serine--tRNA ligase n=1 Tax=Cordyceps fumosorosea (strain ARSEF 2679) TaxID=1081104 RepID=A0A162JU77_CORFA|nr:seryl-tRNA synthetase synthetase [Cordyceps fumosorosea ARSEF 2679]OAA73872.1 seryl-tRNA synthetase synthetase [Cordyceps fumosorosea ARSEF 2679]